MKYMEVLSNSLILVFLAVMLVLPANAALLSAGPTSTVNGFPLWYTDANNLNLSLCLDQNGLCVLPKAPESLLLPPGPATTVTFDPALPIVFPPSVPPFFPPGNFPVESSYWNAVAKVNVGNLSQQATISLGLFASFVSINPPAFKDLVPENTHQTTFLRTDFRLPLVAGVLTPNSTYTVIEPFGIHTFTTDAAGIPVAAKGKVVILLQDPVAPVALDFVSLIPATTTLIGPFLTWTPPLPPPDPITGNLYIGDPLALHTITPGPTGVAVFSITGPNAGGPGVNIATQTLWSVSGKIADVIPPVIVSTNATPPVIEAGSASTLTVAATDNIGVSQVTADLSQMGMLGGTATINGAQVPTNSLGTGSGTFTIDTNGNTLSFNIAFSGLSGPETVSHIHGPALPGQNAGILFLLPLGSPKVGVWNYPQAQESNITSGLTYVNIHSTIFPAGEIRGQIITAPTVGMNLVVGSKINGNWKITLSPTATGTFTLPVTAIDGSGNAAVSNVVLTVVAPPVVTASPNVVTPGNATNVTITVTQGGVPAGSATVTLSGAVLPAPLTGITDINGNASFSVNAIGAGTINVTATNPAFLSPGLATITASLPFVKGDANGNNVLDVSDALFTLQAVAGLRTLTATQTTAADVNGNGVMDVVDGLFIAQAVAGTRTL